MVLDGILGHDKLGHGCLEKVSSKVFMAQQRNFRRQRLRRRYEDQKGSSVYKIGNVLCQAQT